MVQYSVQLLFVKHHHKVVKFDHKKQYFVNKLQLSATLILAIALMN